MAELKRYRTVEISIFYLMGKGKGCVVEGVSVA